MKKYYLNCRFCGNPLTEQFADLGMCPLANSFIPPQNLYKSETYYPLNAHICSNCFLVQLDKFEPPENIFIDYAYFSSFSDEWLKHVQEYTEMMTSRFHLNSESVVIEIASNDGYLLQYFQEKGIPVLGIDPAKNVAREAEKKGITTITKFFCKELAEQLTEEGKQADLLIGNNVLAHIPEINDFISGMKKILKPRGIITMEFPHLLKLIQENQFDTIYHEHFSYFSFITVQHIFKEYNLTVFDVEEIPTHGGSLRIYAGHSEMEYTANPNVINLLKKEKEMGIDNIKTYQLFNEQIKITKRKILKLLINLKEQGKKIVGYGAPAKGNTLLNYCGIGTDFLDYTVDITPYKQGLYLPGTRIPVFHTEKINETRPDYVLILPWNHKDEIIKRMGYIRKWGGKFIILIPEIEVF
ncbi:MAG: class I SAM-dependent methyltransferase [Clostridiales bacterium]|nr:class I SAM-dependent methyltransferase [Clostridiales bacterium]MCF8022848.1 class I SAM-dependent methyltransferase [Clostridiales bacterium]